MKADLKKKITKIKKKITDLENGYLLEPPNIKDLRQMVTYVHATAERELLNEGIGQYLIDELKSDATMPRDIHLFYVDLLVILDEVDFAKKVKIAQIYQIIPKTLIKKIYAVNQLRVLCSHPAAYYDRLEIYRNESNYLEALVLLESTMDELLLFIREKHKKSKG